MKKLVLFVLAITGCHNPSTDVGEEGYIRRGAIFGSESFYGVQTGPTSTGLKWMLKVENVEFRWKSYEEKFQVMSSDNLNLNFDVHVILRPQPGTVKQIVEVYGGQDWFKRNLQQPFRNAVYEAVAGYKALEAKDRREVIASKIRSKFESFIKNKPFQLQTIVVGTVNLPQSVAISQEKKISKETELSRKEFEIEIAKREAVVRVEEARGIAQAQQIINSTLTKAYLQHEAIMAQAKAFNSPNHTTVYIPTGSNGIPLIKGVD